LLSFLSAGINWMRTSRTISPRVIFLIIVAKVYGALTRIFLFGLIQICKNFDSNFRIKTEDFLNKSLRFP